VTITYEWRGAFDDADLDRLHAQGFGGAPPGGGWWARVNRHSLGWVCARADGRLVGFVNVAWDGGGHAFLLDTVVATTLRRRRVGARLVAVAAGRARAAGCGWLHVDFEPQLRTFYLDACGFRPTTAGVLPLSGGAGS
jgi:GNAT superfamily N-acetyltransferase